MKTVDMSAKLVTFDGTELKDAAGPMTLGRVCIVALMTDPGGKQTGEEKWKMYSMAARLHGADAPVDLDDSDRAMLKAKIGESFTAYIVGVTWPLLA
jgi:hypothetical protein